jgi:hypothetical protein
MRIIFYNGKLWIWKRQKPESEKTQVYAQKNAVKEFHLGWRWGSTLLVIGPSCYLTFLFTVGTFVDTRNRSVGIIASLSYRTSSIILPAG